MEEVTGAAAATAGVVLMSFKAGLGELTRAGLRPVLLGLAAGALFGPAARLFAADGVPLRSVFKVNVFSRDLQAVPAVGAAPDDAGHGARLALGVERVEVRARRGYLAL